jgi:ribokinase
MIIVFGSINMDINIPVRHLPKPGETVLGPTYLMSPGGKGSNQALAAGRMGVKVAMAGKVGDDGMGIRALHSLRRAGVMTSGVGESELPTGCAVITRDARGANHIVVAVGANADIADDQIPDEILKPGNWLMTQGEVPLPATEAMIRRAHAHSTKVVFNFAPVVPIARDVLKMVDILILNEFEAEQALEYLGLSADGAEAQARALAGAVDGTCIITVGEKGSIAATDDGKLIHVPSLPISEVVDSAGAGDAYCGTLVACLHEGKTLIDAMRTAAVAGSLACLQPGTQESFPYQGDIEENLDKLGPHTVR